MDEEVDALIEAMESTGGAVTKAGMVFHAGVLRGVEAVVVRSGIGKVNAAVCAQILIDDYHVDALVQSGIAGSLNKDIHIGDVVLSRDTVHHDVQAGAFGYPPGQIPRMDTFAFEADAKLLAAAQRSAAKALPDVPVHVGRVLSGDIFIKDQEHKDRIAQTLHGDAVEMEGAAVGQAAYLNNTPYLVIRVISDNADQDANIDYALFERMAAGRSVALTLALVEELAGRRCE
jgi:adenosylhomocysteine nucleosidase